MEWHSVDVLSALGALREVRLSGNPFVGGPEDKASLEVRCKLLLNILSIIVAAALYTVH